MTSVIMPTWILFLLTAILVPTSLSAYSPDAWQNFQRQYQRQYSLEEEQFRQQVFIQNLDIINRHNAEFDAGRSTFWLGVNQFADLTNEEFRQQMFPERVWPLQPVNWSGVAQPATGPARPSPPLPDQFDWRQQGVPITVEDQGSSGIAWVIPVASAVEDGLFISGGQSVSLSRQNLVDCVSPASVLAGLQYVQQHGLASEADYPSTAGPGPCQQDVPVSATVDQVHQVADGDEAGMAEGLLENPVPVLINAGLASFQLYAGGIYSDPRCTASGVDHAVLTIGFGSSAGTDYWTLANSWGTSWGERGFIRMERGSNMCGVASFAAYPTGVHGA